MLLCFGLMTIAPSVATKKPSPSGVLAQLNSMPTLDEIVEFARQTTSFAGHLEANTELERDLGVYGDDMDEFLGAYARRFDVDMSSYLWYFHTGEEGLNLPGALFFRPPSARVKQIPITLRILHEGAQRGRWSVEYPKHSIPAIRYDIIINLVFFVLLILGMILLIVL